MRLVQTTLFNEISPNELIETKTICPEATFAAPTSDYHYKTWFIQNYGVDPTTLVVPFKKKRIYGQDAFMYRELDVYSHRDLEGLREQLRLKAEKTQRREDLKTWFLKIRETYPRVPEILQRLYDIGEEIGRLHNLKAECRNSQEDGEFHVCNNCDTWTREQNKLREERRQLFIELTKIAGKSKATIQRARKYIRDDERREHQEATRPT